MQEQIKAKPTTYRGTRFRSKSEARLAVAFDIAGVKWSYEPPLQDCSEWLPDFHLAFSVGSAELNVLVEYKPCQPTVDYKQWWVEQAGKVITHPDTQWPARGGGTWGRVLKHLDRFKPIAAAYGQKAVFVASDDSSFTVAVDDSLIRESLMRDRFKIAIEQAIEEIEGVPKELCVETRLGLQHPPEGGGAIGMYDSAVVVWGSWYPRLHGFNQCYVVVRSGTYAELVKQITWEKVWSAIDLGARRAGEHRFDLA